MSPGCTAAESEIGTLAAAQIGAEQWQGSCANTRCRDSSTAADASVSAPEPTSTRGTLRPITSKSGADDERTALPPTTQAGGQFVVRRDLSTELLARTSRESILAVGALDAKWASPTAKARRHEPPGPRPVTRG